MRSVRLHDRFLDFWRHRRAPERRPADAKLRRHLAHHPHGRSRLLQPAIPFPNQINSRNMPTAGLINLRCNGGHVWMNAEMMVVPHPCYAVTDESGRFEFTSVPPGTYQIVAWHEGWGLAGKEPAYDVLTEHRVERPVFTESRNWEKSVTVAGTKTSVVDFVISEK